MAQKKPFYANKIAPKTAQEVFETLQDASKIPLRRSKTAQDAHKTSQEASKTRFCWIFDAKMDPSWH